MCSRVCMWWTRYIYSGIDVTPRHHFTFLITDNGHPHPLSIPLHYVILILYAFFSPDQFQLDCVTLTYDFIISVTKQPTLKQIITALETIQFGIGMISVPTSNPFYLKYVRPRNRFILKIILILCTGSKNVCCTRLIVNDYNNKRQISLVRIIQLIPKKRWALLVSL